MNPVDGLPDAIGSLSAAIASQVITEANKAAQEEVMRSKRLSKGRVCEAQLLSVLSKHQVRRSTQHS